MTWAPQPSAIIRHVTVRHHACFSDYEAKAQVMQLGKRQKQNLNICLTPKLCNIHQIWQPRQKKKNNPYFMVEEGKTTKQTTLGTCPPSPK